MSVRSNPIETSARRARAEGEEAVHSRSFEVLARAGFVARGLIYAIIGLLALKLALGDGGKAVSQQGALRTIAHQPFGKGLLIAMAIGLAGYSLWRLARAALGHGPEASDSGFDRVAGLASGIAYGILCVTAITILLGSGSSTSGGSQDAQVKTAGVLGWPAGPWIVGLAGAVLVGVGVYQGVKGVFLRFLEDSKTEQMSPNGKRAFTTLGVVGHLARMVVFGLVGWFLIKAAVEFDPDKAVGLDGALGRLAAGSNGPLALGVVAAGLIAFALYSLSDARYRRI